MDHENSRIENRLRKYTWVSDVKYSDRILRFLTRGLPRGGGTRIVVGLSYCFAVATSKRPKAALDIFASVNPYFFHNIYCIVKMGV